MNEESIKIIRQENTTSEYLRHISDLNDYLQKETLQSKGKKGYVILACDLGEGVTAACCDPRQMSQMLYAFMVSDKNFKECVGRVIIRMAKEGTLNDK